MVDEKIFFDVRCNRCLNNGCNICPLYSGVELSDLILHDCPCYKSGTRYIKQEKTVKYIIIGYTSDIDVINNTAKIKYVTKTIDWTENINEADLFETREKADQFIEDCKLRYARSYGVEL